MLSFIQGLVREGKPIHENKSVGVCRKAGIDLLSKENVKLASMRSSLKYQIDELSSSKSKQEFAANALLGLQLVKATCSAFISMSASAGQVFSGKTLAGKAMHNIAEGYSTAQDYITVKDNSADASSKIRAANSIAEGQTKKIPGANYVHMNMNILNSTLAQDYDSLKTDLYTFVYESHKDASELLVVSGQKGGYLSKKGARYLGNAISAIDATQSIIKAAISYSQAMEKAFDEKISNDEFMRDLASQITALKLKSSMIDGRIAEIAKLLNECYEDYDEEEFAQYLIQG